MGVAESALAQTAAYLNQRHQFERPLSAFQGTMLRAADAAIDIEAMRVTLWQAAWRIDTGRPSDEAVAVAKWEAAERGQRVVHATQHLHGGMGADITYPIHRYFLWGKQIELQLGGPSRQLARLGAELAERYTAAWPGRGRRGETATRACAPAATTRWRWATQLGELAVPITRTLIVAGALASRDYQDVHHDAELARERGSKDMFMNILTTNGLVGRYVTDWSGPGGILRQVSIRLGAPNYPGDTMTLTGVGHRRSRGPSPTGSAGEWWSPCGGPTRWGTTSRAPWWWPCRWGTHDGPLVLGQGGRRRHRCHRILQGLRALGAEPGHRGGGRRPARRRHRARRGPGHGDLQRRHQPRHRHRPVPGHR